MFKVGLISDVHTELGALEQALAALEDTDAIVCGGDLVGKGTNAQPVIDLIRQRGIPCVRGNNEDKAPDLGDETLTAASLRYLTSLPLTLRFTWEGVSLLFAHGVPWHNDVHLYPDSAPDLFERVVEEARADVIVLGHTHEVMDVQFRGTRILNPGSVMHAHNGSGTCARLTLPECVFEVYDLHRDHRR